MKRLTRFPHSFIWLTAAMLFFSAPLVFAGEATVEYRLKAAFLLNFAKFTTWPDNGSQVFIFGVFGSNPFGEAIHALEEKKIRDRAIKVEHFSTAAEARKAQVVFISKSEDYRLQKIIKTLLQYQVLTVSDIPGFADKGGAIEFVTQNDRLLFIINLQTIRKENLDMRASLLQLAKEVLE